MVQPGISLDGPAAAFAAATGDNASPSAHSTEISNRITPVRIGDKAYLSMNGAADQPGKFPSSRASVYTRVYTAIALRPFTPDDPLPF